MRRRQILGLLLIPAIASLATTAPAASDRSGVTLRQAIEADWAAQDSLYVDGRVQTSIIRRVIGELGPAGAELNTRFNALNAAAVAPIDSRWLDLYYAACQVRRQQRLSPHAPLLRKIVFTKHFDMGGSHYAYTEGQSDAQSERNFRAGAALCVLEMDDLTAEPRIRTLIEDPRGVIRDPDISFDGKRILFSWKKSDRSDDYHLYEMDLASGKTRQLTSGLGFADYEGIYLPDGQILFNSTRCVQIVDCWWTEVSNLYICNADGRYLRRLTYDQVHTNFPTLLPDGRVLYTRWDYNDRGQIYPQGLFQMNPDGTAQTEYYGNNSWFPTTILHARPIPGTHKLVSIFTGHHTRQHGWLGIIDPAHGRQENQGAQLIAPIRPTPAEQIDAYGQEGDQFQYPYPLSQRHFLGCIRPEGARRFSIYFVDIDGRRELLVSDPSISCNQPLPLVPRQRPPVHPSAVDYRSTTGTYHLQDIYAGPGLAGIERGTIKRLRIIGLEFRAAGIGQNGSEGPAGGALSSTPVSVGNGCWDPKTVLGEATVYEDGSACFQVPAHTPVYFQAIDAKGRAVQTMRSWSTLQGGETFSCVGCHESKNAAPPVRPATLAGRSGPETLRGFYGPPRGFSFKKEIQPILDRHCISCHKNPALAMGQKSPRPDNAFSLLGTEVLDQVAKRRWTQSYLALTSAAPKSDDGEYTGRSTPFVNWVDVQSAPPMLPPGSAGSTRSRLLPLLEAGHYDVKLSRREMETLACWIDLLVPFCADYTEASAWSEEETRKYNHFLDKRHRMEQEVRRNIQQLLDDQASAARSASN